MTSLITQLITKANKCKWESLGTINNAGEKKNLSAQVPKCILSELCMKVNSSYGTRSYYANGNSWKYKAVPVGCKWGTLQQGEHGNSQTEIEILRQLR